MLKLLLSMILIVMTTLKNLYLFQLQYYDYSRLIKIKLKNINYKYLIFIPFIILSFLFSNEDIIIGSILLIILLSLNKKTTLLNIKFTFRLIRLLSLTILFNIILLLSIETYYLLIFFLVLINNIGIIIISDLCDLITRLIINKKEVDKLKRKLKDYHPIIIGITGSYAKTSTKNYIYSLLKLKYNVLRTKGNINTFKGVVSYLNKNLNNNIEIIIIEIGLDKKNGINKFLKLFKFDYAFLTGIEKCHLSTFKSINNIINEKMKLLRNSKVGFINNDNKYYQDYNYNSYSLNDLEYIYYQKDYLIFKIKNIDKEFKTSVIGDHHLINIIGAIKFMVYLKMDLDLIYKGVLKLRNEEHRYELKTIKNILVIDDAYNSNPTSFRYALDSLRYFEQKKILLTPGVIELGKENYKINYDLGIYMLNKIDEVILIGNNAKSIEKAFKDSNFSKYNYFESFKEGFNYLLSKEDKDFIVLIENDLLDYYLN